MELQHFLHWASELRHRHVRRVFRALASYGIVAAALVTGTALALHDLGDSAAEQQALDALHARFEDREPFEIALVHAWRGDRDAAFEWLDRAVAQRGGRGVSRLAIRSIKDHPLLRGIRDDPRYQALLRRMGLPAS